MQKSTAAILAAAIVMAVVCYAVKSHLGEPRLGSPGGASRVSVVDPDEEALPQDSQIDAASGLLTQRNALVPEARLESVVLPTSVAKEQSPDAVEEELRKSHALLEELSRMESSLAAASSSDLAALKTRIRASFTGLCGAVFKERHKRGLFESRLLKGPVSMRALEEEFGCKLGTLTEQQQPDGSAITDIVPYPRAEYPEIYELEEYDRLIAGIQAEQ